MSLDIFKLIQDLIGGLFGSKSKENVSVPIDNSPPTTNPQTQVVSAPVTSPISNTSPVTTSSPIPNRNPYSVTGSGFIQANMNLVGAAREANILREFQEGNIPDFLRNFVDIKVTDGINTIIYKVMPDYLSIGSDEDYVRVPMNPHTAQSIADQYDCTLITRKMVNDIWKRSVNKLSPKPWGPPYNADMEKTHRIGTHSNTIQKQLTSANLNPFSLTSGHKKDVVLTNRLAPNNPNRRVAIYGWIQLNGKPIQDLNPSSHDDKYADYSHGIRLADNIAVVNGQPMRMKDVFKHPTYSKLVSDEGPLNFLSY